MDLTDISCSVKPPFMAPLSEIECSEGLYASSLCSADYLQDDYGCFDDSEDLDLLDSLSCEDRAALLPIIHVAFPVLQHVAPFSMTSQEIKLPFKSCHSVPMDVLRSVPLSSTLSLSLSANQMVNAVDDLDIRQTLYASVLHSSCASDGTSQLAVKGALMHQKETSSIPLVGSPQARVTKESNSCTDDPKYLSIDKHITLPLTKLTYQDCDTHIINDDKRGFKDDSSPVCGGSRVSSASASAVQFEQLGSMVMMSNRPVTSNYGFMCNKRITAKQNSVTCWDYSLTAMCKDKSNASMENSLDRHEDHGSQDCLETKMLIDVDDACRVIALTNTAETGLKIETLSECPNATEHLYITGPSYAEPSKGTMLQEDNSSSLIEVPNPELMCLCVSREGKIPLCMDEQSQRVGHGLEMRSAHLAEKEIFQNQLIFHPCEVLEDSLSIKEEPTQENFLLQADGPYNERLRRTLQDYCLTSAEACCSTTEGLGGWHPGDLWARVLEASVNEDITGHVSNLEPVSAMLIDNKFLHAAAEGTIGTPYSCLPSLACASSDMSGISKQAYELDGSLHEVSFNGLCVASGGHARSQTEDFLCTSLNENMSTLKFSEPSQVEHLAGESDALAELHLNGSPYLNENDMLLNLKGAKGIMDGSERGICQDKAHFEGGASLTEGCCDRWKAVDLARRQETNQHVIPSMDGDKKSFPSSAACRTAKDLNQAETLLPPASSAKRRRHASSKKLVFKRQRLMNKEMLAYAKLAQTASPLDAALFYIVLQGGNQGVTIHEILDLLRKQGHANLLDSCQYPEFQVKEILTSCAYIKEVQSCRFIWRSLEANDKQKIKDSSGSCKHVTNLQAPRSSYLDNSKENSLAHSEELISLDKTCGCRIEEDKDQQFLLRACQSPRAPVLQRTGDVHGSWASRKYEQLHKSHEVKRPCSAHNSTTCLSSESSPQSVAPRKADMNRKCCILDDSPLINASFDESKPGQCCVNVGSSYLQCAKQSVLGSAYSSEDHAGWCEKEIPKAYGRTELFLTMPNHKLEPPVFALDGFEEHASGGVSTQVESVAGQIVQSPTNGCREQANTQDLHCRTTRNGFKGQHKKIPDEKKQKVQGETSPLGTTINTTSLKLRERVKFNHPHSKKIRESFILRSHSTGTISKKTKKLSGMQHIVMPSTAEPDLKHSLDQERQQGVKGMPTMLQSGGVMGSMQQKYDMQTSPRKRFDVSLVRGFSVKGKRSSSRRRRLVNFKKSYMDISQLVPLDAEVQATRRCNKTDGRYWQCAQYAKPGLKYCERHLSPSTKKKAKKSRRA